MTSKTTPFIMLFADIVGSMPLYEKHGDLSAKSAIESCIDFMKQIITQYHGIVMRTIGDEIMCRFTQVDQAFLASCEIQSSMTRPFGDKNLLLKIRIGFHYGEAILENNEIYGDAVNLAARVSSLAKSEQIIITQDTFNQLSSEHQLKARKLDEIAIKGKKSLITIYDIEWKMDHDRTCIIPAQNNTQSHLIEISHQGKIFNVTQDNLPFYIGRDFQSDLRIDSSFASRQHIKITYNRGKFIATDLSTNGTYVLIDKRQHYFRGESIPLNTHCTLCLGEEINDNNKQLMTFTIF